MRQHFIERARELAHSVVAEARRAGREIPGSGHVSCGEVQLPDGAGDEAGEEERAQGRSEDDDEDRGGKDQPSPRGKGSGPALGCEESEDTQPQGRGDEPGHSQE